MKTGSESFDELMIRHTVRRFKESLGERHAEEALLVWVQQHCLETEAEEIAHIASENPERIHALAAKMAIEDLEGLRVFLEDGERAIALWNEEKHGY